jgi:flagellar basal body-associated protein FliL
MSFKFTFSSFRLRQSIKILMLIILSFALFSPVFAAEEGDEAAAVADDTKYYEISPPFVVNLQTKERRMRFLQVRIQVLGTPEAIEEVQKHNAPIRDIIITLLSEQSRVSVNTPKKKKALQVRVQTEVERILKELTEKRQIEGLYFTNFVIQ